MAKRETILVIAMILGVVYGAWELFLADRVAQHRGKPPPTAVQPDLTAFVTETAAKILPTDAEKGLEFAMALATDDGFGSPFLDSVPELFDSRQDIRAEQEEIPEETKPPEAVFAEDMIYSGFLELGTMRFAIINGIEYQAGETIESEDFELAEIQPNRVVMVRRHDGQRVVLPLND